MAGSSSSTSIHVAKKTLRQEMKFTLLQMNMEEKLLQSNYVTEKLLQHSRYVNASRIGIYLSLPDEIQTDNILKHMFESGKICFIPRYNSTSNSMQMIRMKTLKEGNLLPKTNWGIRQPLEDDVGEDALRCGGLDLLIIPGRAFTKYGHRLGRGKGYYDRYLHDYRLNCKGQTPPYTIGLAYAQQILPQLPTTCDDINLDQVIFDDRYELQLKFKYE